MFSVVAAVELTVEDPFHLLFEDLGVIVGVGTILIFWECQFFDCFLDLLAGVHPLFERHGVHRCRQLFPRS